jgi:crotonobetainyl-CoA:carnitine CoA-transferase CaiB-like acyl-CoA transferase
VVIESLGASAAGLESYEQVRQRHPKLIWCAITGTGHGNGGRAIDPSLQASMGMMALTGEAGRAPMRLPVPLVDFMTGMYALQAILAALMQVRAGGDGMLLDCALLDSAATLASTVGVYALNGPEPLRRMGTESVWYVPASNFPAADGQWVQVMAINDGHWRGLCRTLGHPEWIDDPRMADNAARVKHRELVHGLIGSAIATDTAEHWAAAVTAAGGFCQQIREIEEAWSDPLLVERRLRAEGEVGGVPFQVPVASLARTPLASPLPPGPRLGEHSEAIAAELGLPPAEIAELLDERVLVRG